MPFATYAESRRYQRCVNNVQLLAICSIGFSVASAVVTNTKINVLVNVNTNANAKKNNSNTSAKRKNNLLLVRIVQPVVLMVLVEFNYDA